MPTIDEIRKQYPQYENIPDAQLARGVYNKFYKGKIEYKDFLDKLGMVAKGGDSLVSDIGKTVTGTARTAGVVAGGAVAFPIAGLAGYAKLLTSGPEEAIKTIEQIQSVPMKAFHTDPARAEVESRGFETVTTPIRMMTESAKWWGDLAEKKTGNPNIGALVATGVEAAFFLGLPGLKAKLTGYIKAGRIAEARKLAVDLQKKRVAKIQSEPPRLKGLAQAEKDVSLGNLTKKGPPLKKPKFESTKAPVPEPLKVEVQPRPESPFGLKKGKPAQRPQSTKVTREKFIEKISEEPPPSNVNNLVKERNRFFKEEKTKPVKPKPKAPFPKPPPRTPLDVSLKESPALVDMIKNRDRFLNQSGVFDLKVAGEAVSKLYDNSKELAAKINKVIDVESPYRRIGKPETGFHVKNTFSQRALHEEYGLNYGEKIGKSLKYNKEDMSKVPLYYENPKDFKQLPRAEQKRLGPAVKKFGKYFEDAKAEYAKLGVDVDFKSRIIQDMKDLISEAEKKGGEATELRSALKDAEKVNFVHIPSAMWFEGLMKRDPASGGRVLKLLATQQRKNLSIKSLIEREIIKPEDVHATDIIANYSRRKGKDFALLNIVNAAKGEGMAVKMGKGVVAPENFITPPDAPILAGYKVHPLLAEAIRDMTEYDKMNLWQKTMTVTKMTSFYNPLILPMYDTVQGTMLRGLKSINLPTTSAKGLYHTFKKTPEYWEALDNGLASKPFNAPWNEFQRGLDIAKKGPMGKVLSQLSPNVLKTVYQNSWWLAWELDKGIRMGSYLHLKKQGMSPREAAQTAAKFHSDYASVPAKTRKALNNLFFTPTFKITMGKLFGRMIKDAAQSTAKLGKVDKATSTFGKGLLATVGILEGVDLFMTQVMKFERDEWGRKYTRKNVETEDGPKDLVFTWSSPVNMFLKYGYRLADALDPSTQQGVKRFLEANKWEFHPIYRTFYDVFFTNKKGSGENIVETLDPIETKAKKQLIYAVKSIIGVLGLLEKDDMSKASKAALKKETNRIFEFITRPITFRYLRATKDRATVYKINRLNKELTDIIYNEKLSDDHIEEYLKRYDKLIGEVE